MPPRAIEARKPTAAAHGLRARRGIFGKVEFINSFVFVSFLVRFVGFAFGL